MSLAAAISTFSSCNKPGSIPLFTAHLRHHPDDYTALRWRGIAHHIIENNDKALADFEKAKRVSIDPRRSIAEALCERVKKNFHRSESILDETTKKYPRCGEAWYDLGNGFMNYFPPKRNEAEQAFGTAISIGATYGETEEPWYHWACCTIGDIFKNKGKTDDALFFYKEAVDKCGSFTKAHFGMCNCYLEKGDRIIAKQCFNKARSLNSKLIPWETMETYESAKRFQKLEQGLMHLLLSAVVYPRRAQSSARVGARRFASAGGASGGGGGSNDGSDDDDDGEKSWDDIRRESPCVAEYNGRIYVQSKDGAYWYSRDKASHGGKSQGLSGSFVKVYENRRSSLEFIGSKDNKMRWITRKHESAKIPTINKNDLNIRFGAIKKR